jgi:hypothetical protein
MLIKFLNDGKVLFDYNLHESYYDGNPEKLAEELFALMKTDLSKMDLEFEEEPKEIFLYPRKYALFLTEFKKRNKGKKLEGKINFCEIPVSIFGDKLYPDEETCCQKNEKGKTVKEFKTKNGIMRLEWIDEDEEKNNLEKLNEDNERIKNEEAIKKINEIKVNEKKEIDKINRWIGSIRRHDREMEARYELNFKKLQELQLKKEKIEEKTKEEIEKIKRNCLSCQKEK